MPSSDDRRRPGGRTLDELAAVADGSVIGDGAVLVRDVTHDSRGVGEGVLFVAVRGFTVDGHSYVESAVRRGAAAVAVEERQEVDIPQVVVADTRRALGPLAAEVHGHPSERMSVVGVTGTNGKTSVAHMVSGIVEAAGAVSGVVGTLGARVGNLRLPMERTTPEASDFQRLLARMAEEGAGIATCEVSSHALELGRVDGTRFAVAAFTNLSQDHLDFHGDMERYFRSKSRLFAADVAARAVIWIDDPWGARLADEVEIPSTTVGFEAPAGLRCEVLAAGFAGSRVRLALPDGSGIELDLPIAGRFSVANAAVATGCALALGLPVPAVVEGLEGLGQIPGRFELVSGAGPVAVVVDYSHTPAGIEAAIAAARSITSGRIVAVVGAGGDRDRSKRAHMGAAASRADVVVVTTDNPRSERPGAIIEDIVEGVTGPHEAIEGRREAIARAIALAGPGDAVLIMGKGHEPYQEIGGERIPFDDRVVAREILAAAGGDPP